MPEKTTPVEPEKPSQAEQPWREELREEREKIGAQLVTDDIGTYERAFLATCQRLCRENRGCFTPFQKLIVELIECSCYITPTFPSPDLVRSYFEAFQEDWDDMAATAEMFVAAHVIGLHRPEEPAEVPAPKPPGGPTPKPRRGKKAA